MSKIVRIGGACAFYGDSSVAPTQLIKDKVRKMLMSQGVTDVTPIDIDIDAEFGPDPVEEVPVIPTVELLTHPVTPAKDLNDAA